MDNPLSMLVDALIAISGWFLAYLFLRHQIDEDKNRAKEAAIAEGDNAQNAAEQRSKTLINLLRDSLFDLEKLPHPRASEGTYRPCYAVTLPIVDMLLMSDTFDPAKHPQVLQAISDLALWKARYNTAAAQANALITHEQAYNSAYRDAVAAFDEVLMSKARLETVLQDLISKHERDSATTTTDAVSVVVKADNQKPPIGTTEPILAPNSSPQDATQHLLR